MEKAHCESCHAAENAVEAERERCYRAGIEWLLKKFPDGSPIAQDQIRRQFRAVLGLQ